MNTSAKEAKPPHPATVESWWRAQSATLALLRHACAQLEAAEARLAAQEARVRQLEDLAASDPQTGLMNRRGFGDVFAREQARLARAAREPAGNDEGAVLLLIDLDGFKGINDSRGHLAGDACLRFVAHLLTKFVRATDAAARFGGDEFAVLLSATSPRKAAARVARLRAALAGMQVCWEGETLSFAASLGVAAVGAGDDFEAAYATADAGLYRDKHGAGARRV